MSSNGGMRRRISDNVATDGYAIDPAAQGLVHWEEVGS